MDPEIERRYRLARQEFSKAARDYDARFGERPNIGVGEEEEAWQRMKRAEAELAEARREFWGL